MDERLQYQLQHPDAEQRALALREIVRRGDRSFLPLMADLYKTDPDPRVRQMALAGAKRLKPAPDNSVAQPAIKKQDIKPTAPVPQSPSLADLDRIQQKKAARTRQHREQSRRYAPGRILFFLMFSVIVIGVGGYLVLNRLALLNAPAQRLMRAAANPQTLPPAGVAPNTQPLNGNLYFSPLNNQTSFYVLEPIGEMPPRGWPLLLVIHGSGGNGQHMLPIGVQTQQQDMLLIAPTFSPISPGSNLYGNQYMSRDIQRILREIETRYDIDHNAMVLGGFSMGGAITAWYVARYPGDFDGAGVLGARVIDMPPSTSDVRYVVITGDQDERSNAARRFIQDMRNRGTPPWYGDIEAGVGHTLSPLMVDKVVELVNSLR